MRIQQETTFGQLSGKIATVLADDLTGQGVTPATPVQVYQSWEGAAATLAGGKNPTSRPLGVFIVASNKTERNGDRSLTLPGDLMVGLGREEVFLVRGKDAVKVPTPREKVNAFARANL